jgi:hypothetical protein
MMKYRNNQGPLAFSLLLGIDQRDTKRKLTALVFFTDNIRLQGVGEPMSNGDPRIVEFKEADIC